MAKSKASSSDTGTIKQGSIAEFMRKRTQLVGFDFGLNKHTQYAIEFLDNSLDAVESFQWKMGRTALEYEFKLKDDLLLENFSYLGGGVSEEDVKNFDRELANSGVDDEGEELSEDGLIQVEADELSDKVIIEGKKEAETRKKKEDIVEDDEEAKKLRKLRKKAKDLEQEVQDIMWGLDGYLFPIKALVEREPFVLIQLTEREAKAVYADISKKNKEVFEYNFEIFDNGSGMAPDDLGKFGKYLASSKSHKLKQTRGSQGFGSPSAFSDAQNTTGKPIKVVSKNYNQLYGICSEFYTTSKNNKEYVVPPTEVDCFFEHGTYVELSYLNVKYKRGYIDKYIEQTALTNPHITLIYLDPLGNEKIYPRRVRRFPREPVYALPHPSSTNIGDFQDLLRSSQNLTVSAFMQDNFVRISSSLAREIIKQSEASLENDLGLLNLNHGFITWNKSPGQLYYLRYEPRIFGRSQKKRDKLITYKIDSEFEIEKYWEIVKPLNKAHSSIAAKSRKIRKFRKENIKVVDKKKNKEIKKKISDIQKEIEVDKKTIEKLKQSLIKTVKQFSFIPGKNEIQEIKTTDKFEEMVKELLISKSKPNSLSQKQIESLFIVFKAQKYMAPPNEPAVPIGANILETTLLKEFNLSLSHRIDIFGHYERKITKLGKKEEALFTNRILTKFRKEPYYNDEFSIKNLHLSDDENIQLYDEFFQIFDALHTQEEDFICGHTRPPTSGKGLAFVVEAAVAISPKITGGKQAQNILMRYVNRTPKMRDNSDCAIWKGVQSVKWKNYKLDTFDNKIPKGNIRILVNVSGPYVHLMFKSQAKNALAEDEDLLKEIKMCLEVIGRKIRLFENRRIKRQDRKRRSKTIEKYIPIFVNSLISIVNRTEGYQTITAKNLESRLLDRLEGRIEQTPEEIEAERLRKEKEEEIQSEFLKAKELSEHKEVKTDEVSISVPSSEISEKADQKVSNISAKPEIRRRKPGSIPIKVKSIDDRMKSISTKPTPQKNLSSYSTRNNQSSSRPGMKKLSVRKKIESAKKSQTTIPISPPTRQPFQARKLIKPKSKISIISKSLILEKCPNDAWFNIKDMIKILEITDLRDARFLQIKLKQLTQGKNLLIAIKSGKTYWKKNTK
ncbi:ATP-binding protein [Promethearchaeum syntrophicum]|uniref:ATP-binding protein n=1 Tax=Promethearchaeum syntrophicum TaxID=2594042 RepID=A0A5B9D5F4_9ARCH|nr:ATP-binding protein [Candidatus Prometheoarchaeum syntrophicum]QEE14334.1 Type 2 DNA topoisomerase 6 subunit B [Candidatus Prometheoarchaeum syntrophicum]